MLILILASLGIGMLTPIQTAANARLRIEVQSPIVCTLYSFAGSTIALLGLSLAMGIPIIPTAPQIAEAPWWSWFGGIIGFLGITSLVMMFKAIGQLQTTVLPLLGQTVFSLVIDHFGLFRAQVIPITPLRVFAVIIMLVGVALVVVLPSLKKQSYKPSTKHPVLWQIAGVLSGCLMASLGSIYGALGTELSSATQASTVSFIVAIIFVIILCLCCGKARNIAMAFKGYAKTTQTVQRPPWWMWIGGFCGATIVYGNAWLIPIIGVGVFFIACLLGQMVLSVLLENRGWLGAKKNKTSFVQLLGIALMIVSVIMIRI